MFAMGAFPKAPAFLIRFSLASMLFLATTLPLLADTPGMLRRVAPAVCYCGCNQSHVRAGCARMCVTSRRVSHWSVTSCAKPRVKPPSENPGAGPHFPRSDRAERASR